MTPFQIAALVLGIVFILLGATVLSFRSAAAAVIQKRYDTTAQRYEAAGRTPPTITSTPPGSKFVVFIGVAILCLGVLAIVLSLTVG
ncbi:hypothetical protein [Arthrobacter sp. NPDC093139]|uniref:hypothetical protein n=1 Tax=Arthrobacter sp. NPDC093139 TaxID=3363945 RepID=UPI00381328A8